MQRTDNRARDGVHHWVWTKGIL